MPTAEPITLTSNVAITTATSVTNSVTVSGGGDTNAANNTGTDVTAVQYALDLVLSGWNITTGPAMLFQAYNSITATAFVVNTSSSNSGAVTLQAPHQINLEPGFRAVAGTASPTFRAVIAPVQ
jgi:hypothetical protein